MFVSHTRILTSINFSKNKKKINLKIPKVEHFIHQCYIDVARSFWKSPYLFDDSIPKFDYQRNRRDIETIIEGCIEETIRKQLPVKHILIEYLGSEYYDTPEEEDIENEIPNKYKENLRKMVQAEIQNISEEKTKVNLEETTELLTEELEDAPSTNESKDTLSEELLEEPSNESNETLVKEELAEVPSNETLTNEEELESVSPISSNPKEDSELKETSSVDNEQNVHIKENLELKIDKLDELDLENIIDDELNQ